MKVIKRTLCLLLSLVMVIGMFPMQAFATVDSLELMEPAPVAELPLLEPLPVPEIVPAEIPAEFVDTAQPELPVLPEAGGEAAPVEPDAAPAPVAAAAAVYFNCAPEQLSLYVYDSFGVPAAAQADGAYLLLPGSYVYCAYCQGYESAEGIPFTVAEGVTSLAVDVVLAPLPVEELPESDGDEPAMPEDELTDEAEQPEKELIFTEVIYATFNGAAAAVDGEGNLLIDETNFPDPIFRSFISESYDTANAGRLSSAQVTAITGMDCSGKGITSMAGIEHFTALTELVCSYNSLTELDVSRSSALVTLDCSSNSLTSLNVGNNPALTTLVCAGNSLSSLNLSSCTGLVRLECDRNQLSALDLSANTKLVELKCSSNSLSSLDLSANTAVAVLFCDSNKLPLLDLSANTGLSVILCENQTPVLDAYWENGKLLYNMSALAGGDLSTVDVVDAAYDGSTGIVTLYDPATSTEITTTFSYTLMLSAGSGAQVLLNAYATVQVPEQPGTVKINEANFPDAAFRSYISESFDKNGSGVLSPAQIAAITAIQCPGLGIASLKGVELLTAVKTIDCRNNNIGFFDLSAMSSLERVIADGQTVSAAAGWNGDKLSFDLGALVGAENKALPTDVTGLNGVMAVYSRDSGLVALDIIPADNLSSVSFSYRTDLAGKGSLAVTVSLSVPAYEGEKLEINDTNFPNAAFRSYISDSFDKAALGYLTRSQLDAVTVMDCSDMAIANLKGIEFFTGLEELICSGNDLGALDLSANTALSTLDCSNNLITELGLGNNSSLSTLVCSGNALTALDLSGKTALVKLYCSDNALSSLNVSGCSALSTLDCVENKLTALDVSGCAALEILWCGNNDLSTLGISGCTALIDLRCADNKLTALDVSGCAKLSTLYCGYNALTGLDVSANTQLSELSCSYQESERNAFWEGDNLYFDLGALVGKANLAKVSNLSVERYDEVNGIVTVQLAEDKDYVSQFSYDYAVTGENIMSVSIHVVRPEKPVGGSCGENINWVYDPSTGSITVSGSGDMEDYNAGGAPWDEYKDKISSIVIDSGVTGIADNAFAGFSNVSSVTIPEGVTTIGDGAFAGMSSLEKISIPAGVTSIGAGAFSGCTALEEIKFNSTTAPNCDWNSWEDIDVTVNFPASNKSWLEAMDKCQSGEGSGITWRIAGSESYSQHIKTLVETYSDSESCSIGIAENVKLDSGMTVPGKVSLTVNEGVTLELKGQLNVKGSAVINGSLIASNLTVGGSLEAAPGSSISVNTLAVDGTLHNIGGSIQAGELVKIAAAAEISISDGGRLDASAATINNPNGVLIQVDGADYTKPSEAVSENLFSHINYSGAQPATDEELAALLASAVAKMDISITSDLKLTADAAIGAGVSLTVSSGSLSTEGFALDNKGSIRLLGDLKVKGGSLANNGSILLSGGSVLVSDGGRIAPGSGSCAFDEGFGARIEDIDLLVALGIRELTIRDTQYELEKDMTLPSAVYVELDNVQLTIPEGLRLTKDGSRIVLKNGSKLVVDGTYDGAEIAVHEGCAVEPAEKISSTRTENGVTYVTIGIPAAEAISITDENGEIISGDSTLLVDMADGILRQLKVKVEPENASQLVTWTSNNTRVATIDRERGLLTLMGLGQVSITATTNDAGKKTATVNIEVVYAGIDSKTKFTAAIAAKSLGFPDENGEAKGEPQSMNIGLQKGDAVQLDVYGTDKNDPLPASLFTYEPANATSKNFVKVDEDTGIVTALESGGAASVKASFRDDPLKRSVTVAVKTIPVQTNNIKVLPRMAPVDVIEGVDANGNLCRDSGLEPVSYAIFVDKVLAGTPTDKLPSIDVELEAKGADGNPMEIVRGKHTWASTGTNIATVKENIDGTATITIKANVDGACSITATAKDAGKAQGSIAVYVRDYAPRLEAASLTIDSQKLGEASLGIVESYEAKIDEQKLEYKIYDSKTRSYIPSGDMLSLELKTDEPNDNGFEAKKLYIKLNGYQKNQTIKGMLCGTATDSDNNSHVFELPLNLVIKNAAPAVTVKQLDKFNLFYTGSETNYSFTTRNDTVTDVELESTDFVGRWNENEGKLTVSYKDPLNVPAKPNTKVLMKISLIDSNGEPYANPVEKTVSIGTTNTRPVLTFEPASLVINSNAVKEENIFRVRVNEKSGKLLDSGKPLDLGEGEVNLLSGPAGFVPVGDGQYISFTVSKADIDALKSGKLSFTVQDDDWTSPITVSLGVSKNTAAPTAKLGKATLKLNSAYAETRDETTLSLSYANMTVGELQAEIEAVKGSEGLNVVYDKESGKLTAAIKENATVAAGNYSYKLVFADETYKPISFTVSVTNAPPAVKLSKTTVNLSASYVTVTDSLTVNPVTAGHSVFSITGIDSKTTAANAAEYAKISFNVKGNVLEVFIHDKDKTSPPKAGSYSYTLKGQLNTPDGTAEFKPINFTVKVLGNNPSAKLSKTSVTLNNVFTDYTESVQILPVNTKHNVFTFSAEPKYTSTNAAEIDKIDFIRDYENGTITAKIRDEFKADPPKTGTYSFTVTGFIDTDGTQLGEGYFKPLTLSVKVVNTMPKLTLSSTTLNLNTAAGLPGMEAGMISVVAPAGYEVVKTEIQRMDTNAVTLEHSEKISIAEEIAGGNITASLNDTDLPKAGTYKFRATPWVRIAGTDGEGTALTPLNFSIKVYANAKQPTATVTASGKLDATLRDTSAITYTLTKLTNISGEVLGVRLSGQNADMFEVELGEINAKGQPTAKLKLKDGEDYDTKTTYKVQLDFILRSTYSENLVVSTNVLSVKVISSPLKLAVVTKQQNIFQSQSRSRTVYYTVKLNGPAGVSISPAIETGSTGLLRLSLVDYTSNIRFVYSSEGIVDSEGNMTIAVTIKDTSKLNANKSYTLPLLISAEGAAANAATKLNLTLKVFK